MSASKSCLSRATTRSTPSSAGGRALPPPPQALSSSATPMVAAGVVRMLHSRGSSSGPGQDRCGGSSGSRLSVGGASHEQGRPWARPSVGNDGPMSGMTPHVALLANPAARAGRDLNRVLQRLQALGVAPDVLAAGSSAEAIAAAERAVADGTERLVVVGGDGIVHLAAGALAGSSTALGIIAAGTGNDAARALGLLDGDLGTRVDRVLDEPTAIDMISGGDRPAVTNVIIGFPATVNERANRMRMGAARYTV
ncbi:MAG TPA: hypothetical protein DC084_22210, partial [Cupriavidus sp.]|nr:hypothetical protein [Cupriavidus sp.]